MEECVSGRPLRRSFRRACTLRSFCDNMLIKTLEKTYYTMRRNLQPQ